ncbi:M23 family metallopeptidase [bacterium LRH843]|nr:M23 family metallopeptidase [bacterium LRH843]
MSKRLRKVRRELEARRRELDTSKKQREKVVPITMSRYEEAREEPDFYVHHEKSHETMAETNNFILFRILAAVCLFLLIAILFKTNAPQLDGVKQFVQKSYEEEFHFAAISNWYEDQFGRPLALVPMTQEVAQGDPDEQVEMVYALPAAGVIREDFSQDGRGVIIETGLNAEVEAIRGGYVIDVKEGEESLGKTVIVQHYDGTESLYGMLDEIKVNKYDHIQAKDNIGIVSTSKEGEKGVFYFALKKNDIYIDPSEVLTFD